MTNNLFTLGLNVSATKMQMDKQLKQIAKELSDGKSIQVTGGLNLAQSQKLIQSQLNTISNNLKVGVQIDTASIKQQANAINQQLSSGINTTGVRVPFKFDLSDTNAVKQEINKIVADITNNQGELVKFRINVDKNGQATKAMLTYRNALNEVTNAELKLQSVGKWYDSNGLEHHIVKWAEGQKIVSQNIEATVKANQKQIEIDNQVIRKKEELIERMRLLNTQAEKAGLSLNSDNQKAFNDLSVNTSTMEDIKQLQHYLNMARTEYQIFNAEISKGTHASALEAMERSLRSMPDNIALLEARFNSIKMPETVNTQIKQLKSDLQEINNIADPNEKITKYNEMVTSLQSLQKQYQITSQGQKNLNANQQAMQSAGILTNKIIIWMNEHKEAAAQYDVELKKIIVDLQNCSNKTELLKLLQQFRQIRTQTQVADSASQGFFRNLKTQIKDSIATMLKYQLAYKIIQKTIQAFKQMVNAVCELDASLTEFNKIASLSIEQLEDFTDKAFEAASKIGRTGKDMVDAATEFKRAGYDLNQSLKMGEAALILTNVADGVDQTSDAASTLISVLKGFNISESNIMDIVDKVDNVANNSPVGFSNLADGLERVSGTMFQAGNSIDETIGLLTGGFAQLRNMEKVSSGLITISQRLRAIDEDGEEIDGLSAELEGSFGSIGVSIEDTNGELRSTYEILADYAKVFPKLTSEQKQYFAELAAGKRQVNVFNAIIQQMSDVDTAIEQSINSFGAAERENEIYRQSIQGMKNEFDSAFQMFATEVISSDWIKDLISTGTDLLEVLTNIVKQDSLISETISIITDGIKGFLSILKELSNNKVIGSLIKGFLTVQTVSKGINLFNFFSNNRANTNAMNAFFQSAVNGTMQVRNGFLEIGEAERQAFNNQKAGTMFANGFGGILSSLKGLRVSAESVSDFFENKFSMGMVKTTTDVKGLANAYGVGKQSVIKYMTALQNGSFTLKEGQTYLSAYQAYLQSTGNAFTVAAIKARVFEVAAKAISTIGWMALITFGTTALMKAIDYLTGANERFMESQQDIIDKADENIQKYDEESKSLEELQTKLKDAKNDKEALAKIQSELNNTIGDTPGLLNNESNAWDVANQKITDRIARLKELRKEELKSKITAEKEQFDNAEIDNGWLGIDRSFDFYLDTTVGGSNTSKFLMIKNKFGEYLDDLESELETVTIRDVYETLKKNGYGEGDKDGNGKKSDAKIFAEIIGEAYSGWGNPNDVTTKEIQGYFTRQTERAQNYFKDSGIFENLSGLFSQEEINSMIARLVEGGYAADLEGIQNIITEMMENEELPKMIDEYCKSLFNDSEDSDMLYEQVKAQFDELNQKYPMLKGILDNVFNNIGTDIENASKQAAMSLTPSLFDDLTSIKEKMDTLTSSTSSLSSALTTLYSGDYNSTDLLSSITTINSAIADFGTGITIDWEHITSVDQLEEELQRLSEVYAESMLSNAGITVKNNPFAKMIQNSIVETVKLKAQLDGVNTALDTLQSNYKTLTDTIETYNEYGYITIDQLQSLLEMDDKYIACLIDENGQLNLNKAAYANLTKMQLENAKATALTEYESEVARIKQDALTRANKNLGASIGAENAGLIGKLDSLSGRFTVLSGVISVAKNIFGKFKNAIDDFKSKAQVDIDNIVLDKQAEKELEEAERAYNARLKLIGSVSDNLNDSMDRIMGNSDSSSKSSSSDTVFDWIETRINRIQRLFQNMVDSVTKYVSNNFKLTTIDKEINSLDEQIHTYQLAAQRYLQQANSISISGDLRHKVINGEIDIQTLSDEDTIKAVNNFKEWYEKYLDAIDQAIALENDKRDKIREKVDTRLSAIQSDRERLNVKAERKKDAIDYKEIIGGNAYSSEYQWLIKNSRQQYDSYQSENSVLKEYLSTLTKTSEEWEDIQKQIESNESSMRDLISSQTEWNHKIAQMPIEKAERTIEKLSAKNEFINAKYENSNYALHKQQMNKQLANNARLELKANQTAYTETKTNFYTASYNINHMTRDSLVAKVQKYTKAGKEIPSDILSLVYNSGNTLLIHRCSQYNAAYLARETAKDTYNLSKEQTRTELNNLGQKNVEAVSASFTNKYTKVDNKKSYLDALKENTEANGRYVDSSYYNQMIAQVSTELNLKTNEQKKLQAIIDKNLQDGLWTTESQTYKEAVFQVEQLKTEIVELTTEQKNYNNALNQLPIDRIQTALDILDGLANRDASKNSLKKAQGKDLSVADYQKELDNTQNQIDKTLELRDKFYTKYMNAKSKGNQADADKYLQLYYEEDTAVNNLKESYEELKDTMRDDVYWRSLERAHKAAQNLKSTLSALSDLFSEDMFFDDNGSFTDMAVAKIGTLVKQYETAKEEVNNYTNDIENLNNLYKNGYYTQEEYKKKLAELQDGLLGATGDVKTYTDSIIELYISQKDAELESLKELIDKRKEALNAKKAYYDYDKTIKDKTKDIKSLQSQIAALEGVETAEAKAQLAKYKSQLQEAQEDLEDTKFEHKIELIVDGFDSLQTELQENHDEYVKNLKSSFDAQIDIIESANSVYAESYKQIIQSMTKMLEYYGVDTSTVKIKSLAGFAEGGIVRQVHKNGDKALVSVNPDETILTEKFTNVLPESVDIMSQFVNMPKLDFGKIINISTPDFNAFIPNANRTPVVNIHYDNLLTVNGDVIDLEKATMDIVNNNMKMIANGVSKDFSQQIRKMGFK